MLSSSTESTVVEDGATILDVLPADCWRLVLNKLSIFDIVRSERVSRAWQQMVQEYLAGEHNFAFTRFSGDDVHHEHGIGYNPSFKEIPQFRICRAIKLPQSNGNEVLLKIIKKIGPYCTTLATYDIERVIIELAAIAENCPNLTDLRIYNSYTPHYARLRPPGEAEKLTLRTEWKHLKRVTLDGNYKGDNNGLLKLIVNSEALEHLMLTGFYTATGTFLTHLKTHNLKTLGFHHCPSLEVENIVSVVDRLTGLTRLDLYKTPWRVAGPVRGVHVLLNKMPNLEYLTLSCELDLVGEVKAAIGRLSRLRVLKVQSCSFVTDEWLAAVVRGCPELSVIDLGSTKVTRRGVVALCRARPALVDLGVSFLTVTDEDLEACARCCRGLERLDANACHALTPRLPARLAWPRARPLLLKQSQYLFKDREDFGWKEIQASYEGLTVEWFDLPCDPVFLGFWY